MRTNLFFLLFFCGVIHLQAQQLLTPSFAYSSKKDAFVTLADGTELVGRIIDIDRKKGLIEFINIKDATGKKHKLKPEMVHHMYLAPSGLDALGKSLDKVYDVQKWKSDSLNSDLVKDGYVYFESVDVKLKKGTERLLMQLLNPTFCKHVKIYHDPRAAETTSVGVSGFTVAGGDDKSYYVTKGNQTAVRLMKKDYKELFNELWGECPEVKTKYPNMRWTDLEKHVVAYSDCKG
jgi:hypothetical protein